MNAVNTGQFEVSLETAAGLERRLTVRVPSAEIERAIDARLVQVGKTAKLKAT
jgi:FKBP-type peptidyl-prolyl cis-trans isomerase (trigger factor)